MKSARHKRYTVDNNINATHNLLAALVETGIDAHLVHLGTMGVYGYGTHGAPIPEGYLPVQIRGGAGDWVEPEILPPASPGRVYHMTKVLANRKSVVSGKLGFVRLDLGGGRHITKKNTR